mmetsp:Transcript_23638/g.55105  ORF Transcript_23638/g.55105 Transcript_23638/m.55105 type:complete len:815 (+) Transcript_23638:57-2501(+)
MALSRAFACHVGASGSAVPAAPCAQQEHHQVLVSASSRQPHPQKVAGRGLASEHLGRFSGGGSIFAVGVPLAVAAAAASASNVRQRRQRPPPTSLRQGPSSAEVHRDSMDKDGVERGTTIVDNPLAAKRAVAKLRKYTDRFHAVDTEVLGWNPGVSPYQKGTVFCFTIYCGDDVDFGSGPRLFVDDLRADGTTRGLLKIFREYFEDADIKKVFHNYSFDRAQLCRQGIHVKGFCGDTMQMAQLDDALRSSYKLEYLGLQLLGTKWVKNNLHELASEAGTTASEPEKMHLSQNARIRAAWVDYSAFDAQVTWKLYERLRKKLQGRKLVSKKSLLDLYEEVHAPWLEVMVNMEERGLPMDEQIYNSMRAEIVDDIQAGWSDFKRWLLELYRSKHPDDDELLEAVDNISFTSTAQIRHIVAGWGFKEIAENRLLGLMFGSMWSDCPVPSPASLSLRDLVDEIIGACEEREQPDEKRIEALTGLRKKLRSATQDCPLAVLRGFEKASPEGDRVQPMFRLSSGIAAWHAPTPLSLKSFEPEYPGISDVVSPPPGQVIISASYKDLPMALLAHMADDMELQNLIKDDKDLNAWVAYKLHDEIRQEVEAGRVDQERSDADDSAPAVQDKFPYEYEEARILKEIYAAWGPTHGATSMWSRDSSEALAVSDALEEVGGHLWTNMRWEKIDTWREAMLDEAKAWRKHTGVPMVFSLRGRGLNVEDFQQWSLDDDHKEHLKDKALATLHNGSLDDVVKEAALKLACSEKLQSLNYHLILQSRHRFKLEGPEETAAEAAEEIRQCLEHPFVDSFELKVPLRVLIQR